MGSRGGREWGETYAHARTHAHTNAHVHVHTCFRIEEKKQTEKVRGEGASRSSFSLPEISHKGRSFVELELD